MNCTQGEITHSIREQKEALEVLQQRVDGNEKLLPLLRIQQQLRRQGLALLPAEQRRIEDLIQQQDILNRVNEIQEEVTNSIKGAVDDLLVTGAKLSDVLRRLEQDLTNIILRKAALEPLSDFFSGAFRSATGGLFETLSDGLSKGLDAILGGSGVTPAIDPAVVGFHRGGSFRVGGSGGPDSIPVPLMLFPGELVSVAPANRVTERGSREVHIHPGAVVVNITGTESDTARFSGTQIGQDIVEQLLPLLQRL